ncbi:MAG: ZIP family metal transporter, partial [Pseudomonadota bacterium]|nr:ZIP family metal transporter [Pseudomonadota bacterium]
MKYFAATAIFFVGLIIGSIPLFFSSSKKLKALLEYCEALTTGLFLGVGLTHLLPEAVAKYLEQSPPGSQPTTIFAICAGTAIVLQIMESTGRKIARKNNEHAHWLSYFLIMVLSVHSILEGLVLGFEMNP